MGDFWITVTVKDDLFGIRLDQMIDLWHRVALLARRMRPAQIEAALAPAFAREDRVGQFVEGEDLFGPKAEVVWTGVSAAGRPWLPACGKGHTAAVLLASFYACWTNSAPSGPGDGRSHPAG